MRKLFLVLSFLSLCHQLATRHGFGDLVDVGECLFVEYKMVVQTTTSYNQLGSFLMRLIQASETASPASDFLYEPREGIFLGHLSILDGLGGTTTIKLSMKYDSELHLLGLLQCFFLFESWVTTYFQINILQVHLK